MSILASIASINLAFYEKNTANYQDLLGYQLEKIKSLGPEDIAIVGDSSGGNGIDAVLLSKLSNQKITSLTLTGGFGYLGSMEIMQIAQNRGVKKFLIVNTVDMPTRTRADNAQAMIRYHNGETLLKRLKYPEFFLSITTSKNIFLSLFTKKSGRIDRQLDYIAQGPRVANENIPNLLFKASEIRKEKISELRALQKYCHDNKLDCAYLHGPIHESFCEQSTEFLDYYNLELSKIGFAYISAAPYCMKDSELGDTYDHIHPNYKNDSTFYYHSLLTKNFL